MSARSQQRRIAASALALIAALALTVPALAGAKDELAAEWLFPKSFNDWRNGLADRGLALGGTYVADNTFNPTGGIHAAQYTLAALTSALMPILRSSLAGRVRNFTGPVIGSTAAESRAIISVTSRPSVKLRRGRIFAYTRPMSNRRSGADCGRSKPVNKHRIPSSLIARPTTCSSTAPLVGPRSRPPICRRSLEGQGCRQLDGLRCDL